jgi:electron transport complex protein RnfG
MSNIVRLGIILSLITLVAAFVLAEIYSITKPRIELQKQAKTNIALNIVLPNAKVIQPVKRKVPVKDREGNVLFEKDEVIYYKGFRNPDSSQLIGYAFKAYGAGYSSIIETMVGIDTSGVLKKIKIISQKETPGLGALAETSQPFSGKKWSTEQFINKTLDDLKVDKDGGSIVSITGATITSRAITNSIKEQLEYLLKEAGISKKEQLEEI